MIRHEGMFENLETQKVEKVEKIVRGVKLVSLVRLIGLIRLIIDRLRVASVASREIKGWWLEERCAEAGLGRMCRTRHQLKLKASKKRTINFSDKLGLLIF